MEKIDNYVAKVVTHTVYRNGISKSKHVIRCKGESEWIIFYQTSRFVQKRVFTAQRQRRTVGILGTQVLHQLEFVVVRVRDDDDGVGAGTSRHDDADRVLQLGLTPFAIDITERELNKIVNEMALAHI